MTTARQLDLFSGGGAAVVAEPDLTLWAPIDAARLSDRALIAAIPRATQAEAPGLTKEAARRGLTDAIPAVESLCRRFTGFGLDREVTEQTAALNALATLGGQAAVTRLIDTGVVRGPGLRWALEAASILKCRLPPDQIATFLRDGDPAIRVAACRCARAAPGVIAALTDLLSDLHPQVVLAAAIALGLLGYRQGFPVLLGQLRSEPSPEIVAALAPAAEEDELVRLGRTALSHPDLAPQILAALDDCDIPRASVVAQGVRRLMVDASAGLGMMSRDER